MSGLSMVSRLEPDVDFLTAAAAQLHGLSDLRVLQIAADDGRILVTHDRKTMPHAFGEFITERTSPGVIIISRDLPLKRAIDELILVWVATEAEDWMGTLSQVPQ